jgi:hypothetical protein
VESPKPNIVERTLRLPGQATEVTFPFVVVDSPDAWPEASSLVGEKILTFGETKLRFKSHGVSYDEYIAIQHTHHIPEWSKKEADPTPEFIAERTMAVTDRRIALIEATMRKPVPGKTHDEKRSWLQSKTQGEIDALISFVNSHGCAWLDSNTRTTLISQYQAICEQNAMIVNVDSLECWGSALESKYFFLLQRPYDPYITEFQLRGLKREDVLRIQKECSPGDPPLLATHDAGGRINGTVPNHSDPNYQLKMNKANKKELLMYLQLAMPFEIPGTTEVERMEWLGKRVVGDLTLLKQFIETRILSYQGELDLF